MNKILLFPRRKDSKVGELHQRISDRPNEISFLTMSVLMFPFFKSAERARQPMAAELVKTAVENLFFILVCIKAAANLGLVSDFRATTQMLHFPI